MSGLGIRKYNKIARYVCAYLNIYTCMYVPTFINHETLIISYDKNFRWFCACALVCSNLRYSHGALFSHRSACALFSHRSACALTPLFNTVSLFQLFSASCALEHVLRYLRRPKTLPVACFVLLCVFAFLRIVCTNIFRIFSCAR